MRKDKAPSTSKNKRPIWEKFGGGVLAATIGITALAGCSSASPDVSANQSSSKSELPSIPDISPLTQENEFIKTNQNLIDFVNYNGATSLYSEFVVTEHPYSSSEAEKLSMVDLGYLTDNKKGLAARYVNSGIDGLIQDIHEKHISYDEMVLLEQYTDMEIRMFKQASSDSINQSTMVWVYKNLEADNTVAKIALADPKYIAEAKKESGHNPQQPKSVTDGQYRTDDTYGYEFGVDKVIVANCSKYPDPPGLLDVIHQQQQSNAGSSSSKLNYMASAEDASNYLALQLSKHAGSTFINVDHSKGDDCTISSAIRTNKAYPSR